MLPFPDQLLTFADRRIRPAADSITLLSHHDVDRLRSRNRCRERLMPAC